MKKTLIISLLSFVILSPVIANAETYVCAFQCPNTICQLQFTRNSDGFRDKKGNLFLATEDERYTALSHQDSNESLLSISSILIDRQTLKFVAHEMYSLELITDENRGNCTTIE